MNCTPAQDSPSQLKQVTKLISQTDVIHITNRSTSPESAYDNDAETAVSSKALLGLALIGLFGCKLALMRRHRRLIRVRTRGSVLGDVQFHQLETDCVCYDVLQLL
jgi:hypothetical protein